MKREIARHSFWGHHPGHSIAILNGSKAFAALHGRDFVTPEDIKAIALACSASSGIAYAG